MASPTQWTWVWVNSGSWTGWPGVLQSMGSKRVRHDWVTELNWEKGLEGDDCFNQRNDILGLTNPGLKRTGNFCFFPLGSWLRCCEKLQSHKEEPKCSIHSPVVPWAIASTNHLPWGMPSWMFQPSWLLSQGIPCWAGKLPSWAQSMHKPPEKSQKNCSKPLHAELLQSCPTLCDPMNCSSWGQNHGILQARIVDWVPSPGDLPNSEIELMSPTSPALQADSLPTEAPGKPSDILSYGSIMQKWITNTGSYQMLVTSASRQKRSG